MHNQSAGSGELGADKFAPLFQDIPLLPYELELVNALDLSKDEYLDYRNKVLAAKYTRPIGYDHIPDIRCDPTSIIVNLVIGVLLTAASALLAPKPPEEEEENKTVELQNRTGRSRFSETQGIDVSQEVAKLGQTVPILFGRYNAEERTGGIFAPAQLVWSRMYSYGNEQVFKGLFTVGEALPQANESVPRIEGLYIGQLAADAFNEQQMAVYWGQGRLQSGARIATKRSDWGPTENLLFGTRKGDETADPVGKGRDPFKCPMANQQEGPGFSQTITVKNNSEFGVYEPIANGTSFKLNYQIISRPKDADGDSQDLSRDRRRRLCGKEAESRSDGQKGMGRCYTPYLGIVSVIKKDSFGNVTKQIDRDSAKWDFSSLVEVNKNDEAIFFISDKSPMRNGNPDGSYNLEEDETDIEEMRGQSERARELADDMMHVGQQVLIGRVVWQVISRVTHEGPNAPFRLEQRDPNDDTKIAVDGNTVTLTLRYVETTASETNSVIGIAGELPVKRKAIAYEGEGDPYTSNKGVLKHFVPNFFFPVCRFKFATYRNTRPVDVTEIGLQSTVYNRASGMCNFQSLPKPSDLEKYDRDSTQVREGRLSAYFERTSCFILQCRPATVVTGKEADWETMGEQFAVTGRSPQNLFNYIRITHEQRSQMEFRLVPKTSADIVCLGADAEMLQLDAANGRAKGHTYSSPKGYGTFYITAKGRYIKIRDFFDNTELESGGRKGRKTTEKAVTAAVRTDFIPTSEDKGRHQAFLTEIFGRPQDYSYGTVQEAWVDIDDSNAKMKIKVECWRTEWETYHDWYNTRKSWKVLEYGKIKNGAGLGNKFNCTKTANGNKYAQKWGYDGEKVGYKLEATATEITTSSSGGSDARFFDKYSGVAEISHFAELQKSCDQSPEHRISYVNESVGHHDDAAIEESGDAGQANYFGMQMLGLSLRSNKQLSSLNQVRVWLPDGVDVERLAEGGEGPSNLFPDFAYWLLTNDKAGVGQIADPRWLDRDSFVVASKFCQANKIFFDGGLAEKRNVRQFLSEQAPFNLLQFTIANGKLAIVPALPFDSNYRITDKQAVKISHFFNLGNIIEGSYTASYTDVADRAPIRAVMVWREGQKFSQPTKDSNLIRYEATWGGNGSNDPALEFSSNPMRAPMQTFDMSQWCSSKEQAMMIGRFLLSQRQRITHRISFQTTPFGLSVAPGDYIKLDVPEIPTRATHVGVFSSTGAVKSDMNLPDGSYDLLVYGTQSHDVERTTVEIKSGFAVDPGVRGSVFSSLAPTTKGTVYQIEEITITEEGLIEITAAHTPTDSSDRSLIARDVLDSDIRGRFFARS